MVSRAGLVFGSCVGNTQVTDSLSGCSRSNGPTHVSIVHQSYTDGGQNPTFGLSGGGWRFWK